MRLFKRDQTHLRNANVARTFSIRLLHTHDFCVFVSQVPLDWSYGRGKLGKGSHLVGLGILKHGHHHIVLCNLGLQTGSAYDGSEQVDE